MDSLAKKLGLRISEIRREKGMTAEALAVANKISKGYLSDIENGKKLPSLPMLARLAKVLGVPIRDFF